MAALGGVRFAPAEKEKNTRAIQPSICDLWRGLRGHRHSCLCRKLLPFGFRYGEETLAALGGFRFAPAEKEKNARTIQASICDLWRGLRRHRQECLCYLKTKLPGSKSPGVENFELPTDKDWRARPSLDAEGAAAAAGALDVGVVELEAGAFERFDVVDFHALKVHGAHLVDGNL